MSIKKLKVFTDKRGDLTPIEFKDLPFIPERLFIVKNCEKGIRRGEHAHITTQQYLICIKGSIKVITDDGFTIGTQIIHEGQATLIKPMHWDYQEFLTGNDVLLVICSTKFDINDYILDYNEFLHKAKLERKSHGNA